jgi:hypothetical protein
MKKKYLVYHTAGDFTGASSIHNIVEAESPKEALDIMIKTLDTWLEATSAGYAPYYSNVRVYEAPECLAKDKGKDKNDLKPSVV